MDWNDFTSLAHLRLNWLLLLSGIMLSWKTPTHLSRLSLKTASSRKLPRLLSLCQALSLGSLHNQVFPLLMDHLPFTAMASVSVLTLNEYPTWLCWGLTRTTHWLSRCWMNRSMNSGCFLASVLNIISEVWSTLLSLHDEPGAALSTSRVLTCFTLATVPWGWYYSCPPLSRFLNFSGKEKLNHLAKVTQLISSRNFLSGCFGHIVCRLETELSSVLAPTLCIPH